MEDVLGTIHYLEMMARRAQRELAFWNESKSLFPPSLEKVKELRDFIDECHDFQLTLLRPWDRTD